MKFFRFLTLTAAQFADGPALSGILSQEESFSLLMNISSFGATTVPENFTTNRTPRQPPPPPQSRITSRFSPHSKMGSSYLERVGTQLHCICTGEESGTLVNDQLVDCSITFNVNKKVCIYGVVMPTQTKPLLNTKPYSQPSTSQPMPALNRYCELIYAFLQDSTSSRLTYTHFTARVSWDSTMEILFNSPVHIMPNKYYKIVIVLNKVGKYPMYENLWHNDVEGTLFRFDDNPRNGLIKSLIFANTEEASVSPYPQMNVS